MRYRRTRPTPLDSMVEGLVGVRVRGVESSLDGSVTWITGDVGEAEVAQVWEGETLVTYVRNAVSGVLVGVVELEPDGTLICTYV